ncbi:hypothetical protein A2924_02470 [Candidatus Giovannonibacteria bacterium RIFCSPLOWO2_01_FULL_44_16]|uniref:Tyrosine specific protein phosphatases domain-containing protein n=2 Tax=Candidatus Giovannoniibacteriota TaxID=1752738 RepID=A0A1F5X114_9BACT|nr:MAG: hypothetical protein A2924_02470 [Candidatus Giovannonibacteria bacterium RIFCSPLOWO2_01_FULL_44_16]
MKTKQSDFMNYLSENPCPHPGQKVVVGQNIVSAAGLMYRLRWNLTDIDTLAVLAERIPASIWSMGFTGTIFAHPLSDLGGVNGPWEKFLEKIWQEVVDGKRIFAFCEGGHGRTGTFLASLIAMIEKPDDPIAVMRERYCQRAVETIYQAERIFALVGKEVPEYYQKTLLDQTKIAAILEYWKNQALTKK